MSWPSPLHQVPMPGPLAFGQQDSEQQQQPQPQNADLLLQFLKRGGDQPQPFSRTNEPWQLHDPAVAALGPSHSFPLPVDILSPTPARPAYLPRFGWSPQLQPEQSFRPDNPFLTPTDQPFFRPFVPVERPFHAPGAGYPLPNRAYPEHLLADALRPQPPKFGIGELDTPTELSRHKGRATAERPGIKDDDLHLSHQFHGNGAELLQLLQGGRVSAGSPDAPLTENGDHDASKLRGSPSTVHGPIGPPRRQQVVSPPPSSDDLLGRFWPVLPSSSQLLDETRHPTEPVHTDNCYDEKVEELAESGGVFSLLKRGSSKLPLDGFGQNHDSKAGDAVPRRRHYQPANGYSRTRVANGGADLDSGLDDFRRRRVNGRVVKGSAGQWVAVNDKHRDVDGVGNNNKDSDEASRVPDGAQAKDLKRRRKQQQEWRIKCPQADSKCPELKLPRCRSLASQLEHPGLPCGSTQDSAVGAALDESKQRLYNSLDSSEAKVDEETITQYLADLDLDDATHETRNNGISLQKPRPQRYRETRRYIPMHRKDHWFRPDLEKFTSQLISLYRELMPTEGEELSKKKFLSRLDALVEREWPGARLFLFGSCANAFGVCNSDIDVCLTVDEEEPNKAEVVMKMASILQSDDMTNVQALPHARVPIVKFTDPVTQISCDICVNNMLAVVNSKLLHDYSRVDVRLRQLAFMVKHWAKRRKVNETYRGTLSSYAYVLMCIHFLQQRRPPILPCLQEMAPTYEVRVGHIQCSYYDQVENLRDFGARNNETLGELLTAFFEYWAHEHDYNHAVISVRTGGYLSKDEKNWTRRIGNERHLICIEDPFETSHDLGRVVDKHSIKALRGEFFRAANIMKSDPNPCVALFETYVRDSQLDRV